MYWHSSPRLNAGGTWRCVIRRREVETARRNRRLEADRARQLVYWHKRSGGYMRRRKRTLAAQRTSVLEQLDQLAQEALSAES